MTDTTTGPACSGRVPDEWLLAAAVDAFNDGREHLEDFDGDHLEFLRDALAAVIPLARAAERERLAAHLRAIPDDDHGPRTGTRRFLDRHDRLRDGSSMVAVLLAAADEIEHLETDHA